MVRVEKQIDDFTLPVKILSPIGIIVNELITNAMKHAFAGRNDGIITVTAAMKDKHVTISVKDNGNGLPESVDLATSTGLGLQLTGLLADQIDGTIRIVRERGTMFVLEFTA
jgi:two-component system, sensor histidine kinase PdtaS